MIESDYIFRTEMGLFVWSPGNRPDLHYTGEQLTNLAAKTSDEKAAVAKIVGMLKRLNLHPEVKEF